MRMTRQQGFTLIEALGSLVVVAIMMAGLVALVDQSMDDSKGQQASLYQAQVTSAATKYIEANYTALLAAATAETPAKIDIAALKSANLLSNNFNAGNAFGQIPCVLVLRPNADRLEALVVTEGGKDIPVKELSFIASNSGQGGGYISPSDASMAQGAYNGWKLPLEHYTKANCSGQAAAPKRLASAIFFDGPGNLNTDFLYRGAVPGHPELNHMTTPLNMRAIAVEDGTDPAGTIGGCIAGDLLSYGRIARNTEGAVLSCQNGVWKRQGSKFWRDPVDTFADLPATGNNTGDVRMVLDKARAFMWNGAGWSALAVDQNGNMTMEGTLDAKSVKTDLVELRQIFTVRTACSPNGQLGRDANGLLLSCKNGSWRRQGEMSIIVPALFTNTYTKSSNPVNTITYIDLNTLNNSMRPFFVSGETLCKAYNDYQSIARVEFRDASDQSLGFAGGCIDEGIQSPSAARSGNGGNMSLTMVPENARYVRILQHADGHPSSWNRVVLNIFGSN